MNDYREGIVMGFCLGLMAMTAFVVVIHWAAR